MSDGGSRREFLRGILGKARRAASAVPDAADDGPRTLVPRPPVPEPPRPLTPAELERAFDVPADQRDLAEVLVRLGHLMPAPGGRYVARREIATPAERPGAPLGPASAAWLARVRDGRAPDRTRPTDAALLQAARTELARR